MIESIEKEKCTGCKMCADICPKAAISFCVDEQGFWYPQVSDACIKCGLCIKKCPSLNEQKSNLSEPTVYSAWSKCDETRITSTSGGAFWEIASVFMADGGVVVGSRYGKDWRSAEHIIARNHDELLQLKGSKYFQSDTAGVYKAVKQELEHGKRVLFCGTPCQVSALKSFLGKEYENLYCMDFICRSINSPKAFKSYIDELEEKHHAKVIEVQLKNKKNGWQSLASRVCFENDEESIKDKNEDWWVRGFIFNDLYTRESCYHCKYKVLPRLNADITIGDFWGIKGQTELDMFKGISVLLINTEKGQKLFDRTKNSFEYSQYTLQDVLPGNPALLKNPVRTPKQDRFFDLLESHPFSYCVKKCTQSGAPTRIKSGARKILYKCKMFLGLLLSAEIDFPKYIYFNYFCKNVVRTSGAKVVPYKNAVLDLQGTAKIILSGNRDLRIGINKLKGSKAEALVRLNDTAVWNCNNGADLFYGTVIEVKPSAVFSSGFFSANSGSVIISHKQISFGEDVMIGRNVIVYDSDFHTIYNRNHIAANPPKPVIIEDHVWLTSNILVQKGVTIGSGALVTAFTTVNSNVPAAALFGGGSVGGVIRDQVEWCRDVCPLE